MKILFSGGGTLGSVTPLIAIINQIKKNHPQDEIFWVTTREGIEKKFLKGSDIKTFSITSAKWRRYFSFNNLIDFFKFFKALIDARKVLKIVQPDIIFSAGAYVSVPLAIIGKLMGKKIIVHQQDIKVGLANKIMSYFADQITVSFPELKNHFRLPSTVVTGNACRFTKEQLEKINLESLYQKYNFKKDKPILLILGGSSGSQRMNEEVYHNVSDLTGKFQVIHVSGSGKGKKIKSKDYHQYDFLSSELLDFMLLADLIVSRAGLATLTELSFLGKCTILVPLQGHQEINAGYFYQKKAVEICHPQNLIEIILKLSRDKYKKEMLKKSISQIMPKDGTQRIIKQIYRLAKTEEHKN